MYSNVRDNTQWTLDRIDNKIYSKHTIFSPISIQHSFLRSLLASSAYNKQDGSNELCLKRRNAHKHTASPVAAPKSVEPRVPQMDAETRQKGKYQPLAKRALAHAPKRTCAEKPPRRTQRPHKSYNGSPSERVGVPLRRSRKATGSSQGVKPRRPDSN